ncbi:plasma membrane localization protein [Purpureocillium takamizusanense]|uniref:Plasma membrane localization protein n=1 Tax=Purpureocillium takamizusanense TaxID=2060973 RepID=A0A9Q8QTB5_9HYPO|nr:plasma membrane localization protein [Purpureocillium takamizusanense]UNI24299.1 plasma membrane localization protein [Purpureocillium takamizusanense]
MNAIQQKCRPKHQVLVLKCYPRTSKGAVDVKPNSSELSYLLFYATNRRSKIQKIGAFLEKKTASDVWRMRIGNVQVTLGILAALVEKSPKDVALIAPCILRVLDLVLRSDDITMIESSLPTFEAFCEHHGASSLFADHSYLQQYQAIVRSYAQLASPHHVPAKGGPVSRPVQLRWRNAGLDAIKCVASSDALSSVVGRQVDVIVPMILENMWTDDDHFLDLLHGRVQTGERSEADKMFRRRNSVNTVRTADTAGDTNPLAISGTAMDVDKLAEEDIGVLAMQCLKNIFVVPNRAQIHMATFSLLKFISQKVAQGEDVVVPTEKGDEGDAGWAVKIYGIVARWAPVQDRYVILVAALETMMKTPVKDDTLRQHLTLTAMMRSLLRSDTNLIGLSMMDVLLGLVKQTKRLFQLHNGSAHEGSQSEEKTDAEKEPQNRTQRKGLLHQLERCIGDLATHVYYADQISDMVSALVSKLKPGRTASISSLGQVDKRDANENGGPASSNVDLPGHQSPPSDTDFSYKRSKVSALRVIKAILLVANPKTRMSGNKDLSRNRVPVTVWEGTQWLVRDPDGQVRRAYVDALATWLDRETVKSDADAQDDANLQSRSSTAKHSRDMPSSRRAVSGASKGERQPRARRSQFLPLLHLAIYDSALQFVDFDSDIAFLHNLLTRLVFSLGVNATRYGIPMIYRLQEDVLALDQPIHKVRIAALCHGYFWVLTEKFDFESSVVGLAIQNEIIRRRSKGFWVQGVQVPPPLLDHLGTPGHTGPPPTWDLSALETEELLPFDDRTSLVECVATGYRESSLSPPASPAASPGRSHTTPILGSSMNSLPPGEHGHDLPGIFRDNMLAEWSRDSALSALAECKTESITGSKTGTTGTNQNRLTINTAGVNGGGYQPASPFGSMRNLRPHSSQVHGDRLNSMTNLRKTSMRSAVSPSISESSKGGIASVEQLKMILAGNVSPQMAGIPGVDEDEDDSGDSMVSFEYTPSEEESFSPTTQPDNGGTMGDALSRTVSGSKFKGPLSSNPTYQVNCEDEEDVPPVPPLPNLSSLSNKGSMLHGDVSVHDYAASSVRRNLSSRGGDSVRAKSLRSREDGRGTDLQDLLRGIDSRAGEGSLGNLTKPPY